LRLKLHKSEKPLITNNPVVLITGDGMSLPEDIKRFDDFNMKHDLYCIGRSIKYVAGPVDHFADVDCAESIWWAENLPDKWRNGPLRHTIGEMRGFDVDWNVEDCPWDKSEIVWHGSTSLFAVLTCIEMGYKRIVLAGCPLDRNGHWYYPPEHVGPNWTAECYIAWMDFSQQPEAERVRSLSGYTRIIMGDVTATWLSNLQR